MANIGEIKAANHIRTDSFDLFEKKRGKRAVAVTYFFLLSLNNVVLGIIDSD